MTRCRTDPLVHHGRHFGRTIQAFCQVHLLLKQGLTRTVQFELGRIVEEDLTQRYDTKTGGHRGTMTQILLSLSVSFKNIKSTLGY